MAPIGVGDASHKLLIGNDLKVPNTAKYAKKRVVTLPPKYLTLLTMSSKLLARRQGSRILGVICIRTLVTKSFSAIKPYVHCDFHQAGSYRGDSLR
jgi:hypothetical protein